MTKEIIYPIDIPNKYLVQLINLTHKTLQNDKGLLYEVDYTQDLHSIYKAGSRIISYGGIWSVHKKYWPEIMRIYAPLGQQIHSDLNYEIRLDESSNYGHVRPDFFSLIYYPDQGVAYGSIPDSECNKIISEILHIAHTHKHIVVR